MASASKRPHKYRERPTRRWGEYCIWSEATREVRVRENLPPEVMADAEMERAKYEGMIRRASRRSDLIGAMRDGKLVGLTNCAIAAAFDLEPVDVNRILSQLYRERCPMLDGAYLVASMVKGRKVWVRVERALPPSLDEMRRNGCRV